MVTPDYSIVSPDLDALAASQCRLIIKVNGHFLHYIIIYNNTTVAALRYYQFIQTDEKAITEWLEELLAGDGLLKKEWKEVNIIYAVSESQLVPSNFFNDSSAHELLQITNGDLKKEVVLTGKPGGAIYTIFQVPAAMHRFFQNNFTAAPAVHYYDLWMQEELQNDVHAIFYPNQLLVKIMKEGQLQIIQNYIYQTPEDAAYYLLALYAQYDLSPDEVALQVSGMIVRESAIYNELLKYFRTITMLTTPSSLTLAPGFDEYPDHFFSPMLKLAVCAL
jgi:hypothetical protein